MRNREKLLLAYFWGLWQGGVGMTVVPSATSAFVCAPRVVQAPKRRGQERDRGGGPLAHGGLWEGKGVSKAGGCTPGKLFWARIWSPEQVMRGVYTCHLVSPYLLLVLPAGRLCCPSGPFDLRELSSPQSLVVNTIIPGL